jgi:XTP/dITP diphosphohydrolase
MEIVIASHNVHKIRELRELFKLLMPCDVFSLLDFPAYQLPLQEGETFQEHAEAKAVHAAKALGKWVLADDSSLVVPALGGVMSKFYAGDDATDTENRRKVLKDLKGITSELDRAAYYECCLALASPDGLKKSVTAISEGQVSFEERGRNGFGFDAIFLKNDYEKTFAELDEQTKNRVSHRRKAFEKLSLFLESNKIDKPSLINK